MPKITFKFDVTKCIQENEKKKKKALAMLKSEIVRTTESYVPFDKGELARSAYSSINDGTDQIIYRKPYAHFLYVGKVMIGKITRRAWAKKYEKKVYTKEKLSFRKTHPEATSAWFQVSKKKNLQKWNRVVKELFK